jgi:hypothetical protein
MTDILRKAAFTPCLNDPFLIYLRDGEAVELRLEEVSDASTERMESFSLIFRGPLERPFPQGTYEAEHAGLGRFPLFLVPVARDVDGMRYEAVFNILCDYAW